MYLQVQRFREHIQKKHADVEDGDAAPTAESASATPAGSHSQQQVTHKAQQKCLSCGSLPWRQWTLLPCTDGTPPLQGKTMDVGAKAGFYTEKSPKMLLHEWCMQKKRPTPRYRITAAEEGEQITKAKVHCRGRPCLGCCLGLLLLL